MSDAKRARELIAEQQKLDSEISKLERVFSKVADKVSEEADKKICEATRKSTDEVRVIAAEKKAAIDKVKLSKEKDLRELELQYNRIMSEAHKRFEGPYKEKENVLLEALQMINDQANLKKDEIQKNFVEKAAPFMAKRKDILDQLKAMEDRKKTLLAEVAKADADKKAVDVDMAATVAAATGPTS